MAPGPSGLRGPEAKKAEGIERGGDGLKGAAQGDSVVASCHPRLLYLEAEGDAAVDWAGDEGVTGRRGRRDRE
jgi:hypothetical protein